MPAGCTLSCDAWFAQNTPQLDPEKALFCWLLGPLQVGFGIEHPFELAKFTGKRSGVYGLLQNQDNITELLANGPLLGKVELVVAPLAVHKVPRQHKDYLNNKNIF